MSDDIKPTDADLDRDLRADLAELEGRYGRDYEAWVRDQADYAWPAALRRALAAEAEVERLGGILGDLTLLAGHLAVTDGDTTATLGWWVRHALTAPARRDGVTVTDDDGEAD